MSTDIVRLRLTPFVLGHVAEEYDARDDAGLEGDEEYLATARVLRALAAGEGVEREAAWRALVEASNACDERCREHAVAKVEKAHQRRMSLALSAAARRAWFRAGR